MRALAAAAAAAAAVAIIAAATLSLAPLASATTNLTAVKGKAAAALAGVEWAASFFVANRNNAPPGPQGPYLPQSGLPKIGFLGSGGLFIFYAGVAEGLIEKGLLVPGQSLLAGISGGSLVSAVVAAGVPPIRLLEYYDSQPLYCDATLPNDWLTTKDPNPKQSLLAFTTLCLQQLVWPLERIARALRNLIPESAVPQVSRTVQIWASQLNPLVGQGALLRVPYPLGPYSSREDLITKITASSNIPCIVGGTSYIRVNTTGGVKPFVDGGFTATTQQLCIGATEANRCVTVAASFQGPNGWVPATSGIGTCVDTLVPSASNGPGAPYIGYGNYPAVPEQYWRVGTEQCDLPDYIGLIGLSKSYSAPPRALELNINPGKRTKLPFTPCEWDNFFLSKANTTESRMIYEVGLAEARAFAAEAFGL